MEQVWRLDEDGNFDAPVLDSRGVWVSHDVIAYVQFFAGREENADGAPSIKTNANAMALSTESRFPGDGR